MKRLSVLFILALAVMPAAQAQQNSSIEIALGTGYAIPASPMTFARNWMMQAGGNVSVGMALSNSVVLFGSAEYYRFRLNEDGIAESFDTQYMRSIWIFADVTQNPSAGLSSIVTVSAGVRVSSSGLSETFTPYLLAGAGAMFSSVAEISVPATSVLQLDGTSVAIQSRQRIVGGNESVPFFQTGIGIDARLHDLATVFVEVRFALGFSQTLGPAYVPLTAGVRLKL